MENNSQNDDTSAHQDTEDSRGLNEDSMFEDTKESNASEEEVAEHSECVSKRDVQKKALQQLIDCNETWISQCPSEKCMCQKKETVVAFKKPNGQNWHLVSAWGDNTQDVPTTPVKQLKSGKKLKKTSSSGNIKKGCFPSYFQHHSNYSRHMDDYNKFLLKYNNNNVPENETATEQMLVLPDLSSKTIQIGDQDDPYLSKLTNSQNLVERFLLLTDMDETYQRSYVHNLTRKPKPSDQDLSRMAEATPPPLGRQPNLAQVRLQKTIARTESGIKSAPPVTGNKTLNTVQGFVDLKFPTSPSLPSITNTHPDSASGKNMNNKNKLQKENPGSISPQRGKSLQPPNLALYRNFLPNKGKTGTFKGYKDSGTLVLGSTVNNIFNRKNKDFVNNNYLSRNKQETAEHFPLYTSSLPTMTMPMPVNKKCSDVIGR